MLIDTAINVSYGGEPTLLPTKDEVLAELMAEHVAVKRTLGEL